MADLLDMMDIKYLFKNIGVSYSSNIFWKETNGFEADTYYVLKELFIVSDYFFDVGSNIGIYSVLAKKIIRI